MKPYFERDGIVIYHADARDVLPTLEAVDHVITDPPYEAEAHTKGRRVKRSGTPPFDSWAWTDRRGTPRYECLPFAAISDELRREVAQHFGRLVRRWVIVFSQAEGAHKWQAEMVGSGLSQRRWCVWVKPDAQPQFSGDRPGVGYETIVACHAKGRSRWHGGGRVGVFTHRHAQGGYHVTEKPLPLMRELVALFTDPGETILDCFAGSGTTLRAAKDLGRKAIGVEISEAYCQTIVRRLEQEVLPLEFAI
ncbi:MAG TPA: site-specific DNA-methyltransferase [Acetobacteraceae bacterium]|nr:site-specific DNA-methyltransferase [Acetobacteraceae bacterium]